MRAPSEAPGNFALESGIDELSYELGIDALELRLRNYAEVQPASGLPWSSKALRECYEVGAQRFGWSRRNPEVASMRDGHWRIGYGMAGVSYAWWQVRSQARAGVRRDGTAFLRTAATDIGTGTRTVISQLSAELLGLELPRVRVDLGDSDLPWSPAAGGSGLTTSLGTAVRAACRALVGRFLDAVRDDAGSPLRGCAVDDVDDVAGSDAQPVAHASPGRPRPQHSGRPGRGRHLSLTDRHDSSDLRRSRSGGAVRHDRRSGGR